MRLKNEIQLLEIAKHNANSQLSSLRTQVAEQHSALEYYNRISEKKNELIVLIYLQYLPLDSRRF